MFPALLLLLLFVSRPVVAADAESDAAPLVLARMGVMYVGGREISMASTGGKMGGGAQTQMVEQAPVHYLIPPEEKREGKLPIVMVPGMGLTSYLYLGTPDERDGWAQIFAKAGHPVYVFDEPGNAISGFNVGAFNASPEASEESLKAPGFMLWSNQIVWRRWGIGYDVDKPFEDTRYPVDHIDQLYASMTPVFQGDSGLSVSASSQVPLLRAGRGRRFSQAPATGSTQPAVGRGGRGGGDAKSGALVALLEKTGPAVLIVHSASGSTGFEAVRMRPDLVKAVVAIEVVGSPSDPDDIKANFADKKFISIFGDHFDLRPMAGRFEAAKETTRLINAAGGKSEVIHLPELGIKGNTHLMMQDNNNDEIAQMIELRLSQ